MKPILILPLLALLTAATDARAQSSPKPIGSLVVYAKPYCYVGRLPHRHGNQNMQGSATLIHPFSLLTAGHCLYNPGTGWATHVSFERCRYNSSLAQLYLGVRLHVLAGYTDIVDGGGNSHGQAFDRDLGGVICATVPQNGDYASRWANPALLTGNDHKVSLGYGSAVHSGWVQLRSGSTQPFHRWYGQWYENASYGIEGGMSGGPVFVLKSSGWFVAAVNVSGPRGVISSGAGVRALDNEAETFITTYLY
jgi:hypothetical protein